VKTSRPPWDLRPDRVNVEVVDGEVTQVLDIG